MRTLLALTAFMALFVNAHAASDAGMDTDYEWFGKLGFTDVKPLPFVRYFCGMAMYGDGRREEIWKNGFLLEDTPERFRILTLQFEPMEFEKTKQTGETSYRYEPADFQAYVEAELRPIDLEKSPFGRHDFICMDSSLDENEVDW